MEAPAVAAVARPEAPGVSTVWRIMAERMTASWTTAPHFYLVREVNVSRLATWRERASKQTSARITYTDLLVKLVAAALARHPAVNASWKDGAIVRHAEVNIGLAVAIDDGLIVPVIHRADTLSLAEIATRREDVVSRGQAGKLRPADIQGGVFTISNLGMYGVDAFNAIVNPPQAAILAVGRIADRVVAVNGQPAVQPTMVLTLSCDHRALDGARAAQFLGALADLIEEPLALTHRGIRGRRIPSRPWISDAAADAGDPRPREGGQHLRGGVPHGGHRGAGASGPEGLKEVRPKRLSSLRVRHPSRRHPRLRPDVDP